MNGDRISVRQRDAAPFNGLLHFAHSDVSEIFLGGLESAALVSTESKSRNESGT
jgi:hypothetical protein